jgi:Holliday junction resolvase RusA-like endonuclease
VITRFVAGVPATQGSKSAKGRRKNGSTILVESSAATLKPWRTAVVAAFAPRGVPLVVFPGAVSVSLLVLVRRPKSSTLGPWPIGHDTGDLDKYQRAVGDALATSGVISDDSRILNWNASKRYANESEDDSQETGAWIQVLEYPARNPFE